MSKKKPANSHRKERRRSRAEIDRNFFLGDVLIKTGVAVGVALAAIEVYTPFSFGKAWESGQYDYFAVLCAFATTGIGCFFFGQHLRRVATHWDFE